MNKNQIKEKYRRFRQWQEQPFEYTLNSDEEHHCNNCGNDFTGNYCPFCSQRAGSGRIGWHSVRQGVMDIWGLGTRSLLYSVWQLLLRPGYIIGDYIDGKRQVSFPPVKMLFIVAVIYSMVVYWFLPDVLHVSINGDAEQEDELFQWFKNHFSWAVLIISTLAILPTWVMFRYSPRHARHSLPEGFFIQVFFMVIAVVLLILLLPLDMIHSDYLSWIPSLMIMAYYIIGYRQLFGYNLWGTLWRQGFVLLCGVFTGFILTLVSFPELVLSSVEPSDEKKQMLIYILCIAFIMVFPLVILGIGHVINLIATRKARRQMK